MRQISAQWTKGLPHPLGQAGEDVGPWEAVGESESLCQAQSLVQWFPISILWSKNCFSRVFPLSDANFWESGQGPPSLSWHQGGRDCLALE